MLNSMHQMSCSKALLISSSVEQAPVVPQGTPVINALGKQRAMLENVLRACVGLQPDNSMLLELK